jgi:hypothetical protein
VIQRLVILAIAAVPALSSPGRALTAGVQPPSIHGAGTRPANGRCESWYRDLWLAWRAMRRGFELPDWEDCGRLADLRDLNLIGLAHTQISDAALLDYVAAHRHRVDTVRWNARVHCWLTDRALATGAPCNTYPMTITLAEEASAIADIQEWLGRASTYIKLLHGTWFPSTGDAIVGFARSYVMTGAQIAIAMTRLEVSVQLKQPMLAYCAARLNETRHAEPDEAWAASFGLLAPNWPAGTPALAEMVAQAMATFGGCAETEHSAQSRAAYAAWILFEATGRPPLGVAHTSPGALTPAAGAAASPSYSGLPGWFVTSAWRPPPEPGVLPRSPTEASLWVLPAAEAWSHLAPGTALSLLTRAGRIELTLVGVERHTGYATALSVRAAAPWEPAEGLAWLLPAAEAPAAQSVAVNETDAPPGARRWTIGGLVAVLRLTDSRRATLSLQEAAGPAQSLMDQEIDLAANAEYFQWSDAQSLDVRQNVMLPHPVASFRLSPDGPVVLLVEYSGYECTDWRVFIISAAEVRSKSNGREPDFLMCVQ